jgi:hypothetical protein
MAGCFGSHPEDLARERELDRYLGSLEEKMPNTQEAHIMALREALRQAREGKEHALDAYLDFEESYIPGDDDDTL